MVKQSEVNILIGATTGAAGVVRHWHRNVDNKYYSMASRDGGDVSLEEKAKQPTFSHPAKWKAVNISFRNLVFTVSTDQGKRDILKSVSGDLRSGELTAILGSSGAGKSSLMNILTGFNKSDGKGSIFVNDVPRDLNKFRKMSCYIMQQDELCPYLSVIEAMELAANLKLGNELSYHAKHLLIDEILETIGLNHARKTVTSRLSGGERKRLAIALELVNNPPVMFFDEPTSGLDSSSCMQVISLLRTLARGGRTIICVIHQPSSSIFALFDRVYFLTDGQCIYSGPTDSLVRYLTTTVGLVCPSDHNPADFAIEVAVGRFGNVADKLIQANKEINRLSQTCEDECKTINLLNSTLSQHTKLGIVNEESKIKDIIIDTQTPVLSVTSESPLMDDQSSENSVVFNAYGASLCSQFSLLFKRSVQCTLRDLTLTRIRFTVQTLVAIILSLLYQGIGNEASKALDNASLHFVIQFMVMFTALMTTILTFPLETPVLAREHLNNWYTLKGYFLAKSTADIPFEIFHSTVYVIIVYFSTGQPLDPWRFFTYYAISLVNSFVAQSVGLAIGIYYRIETSVFMGPVSVALCMLLSGFFLIPGAAPIYLQWLFYLSYLKYAFQGSLAVIYGFGREKLECSQPYCIYKSPRAVLDTFEVDESDVFIGLAVLVVYFFVVRLLAYLFLWRNVRSGSNK